MAALPILIVEDDADLREALCDTLSLSGYEVIPAGSGPAALKILDGRQVGIVVTDVQMHPMDGHELLSEIKAAHPHVPVLLMTAYGMIDKAVEAMRCGACHYLTKPFEPDRLLAEIARWMLSGSGGNDGEAVCEDPGTRAVFDLARRVARTDATILLTGESGTGKEVLARFLHRHSLRSQGPFVAINCAAIPENLLESTLFGYEKGAFTGSGQSSPGKFEQADKGTLLLDEISEMPLSLQAKLLRVLQEREVERVGGRRPIPVDIRVLATSNRDMPAEVKAGRFREDLYYRLNVFPLHMPALRERPADILPLARHFLGRHGTAMGRHGIVLSGAAEFRLLAHDWPGNIRELENVMQRALILAAGTVIEPDPLLLPAAVPGTEANRQILPQAGAPPRQLDAGARPADMKSLERQHILDTLAAVGGSRKKAAERLGMSERTLRYKLQQYRQEDAGT